MAQTQVLPLTSDGNAIDYTPTSAVAGGDVIVLGSIVGVATQDIAANALGSLSINRPWRFPKITGAIAVGVPVYWDPAGNPVTGTAGSGAATGTAGVLKQIGYSVLAAASGDSYVNVMQRLA